MSANDIYVPGRLTSAKPDKTIAGANEILDDDLHLKQNAINVLTKKVITLDSAPTSSTLTYTYNGVTCNFAIGDEVRVEDSEQGSSETNEYIYYKLFDIDNGVAYWDLVGSGAGGGTGQIGELVSISLITNQNDNSDLIGANVKVFNTDDTSEVFLETTWQGNPIEVEIQVPINYTIQVGNVNGYSTPAVQTYSSRTIRTRNVTFQYNTEVVTVTVNTNVSGVTAEGQVVTINGVNTTIPASGVVTQKVAYGTSYSVSVNSKSGYTTPNSQSFTANSASRSVTMTYEPILYGVFAVTTAGKEVAEANINTSNPSLYVGVGVRDATSGASFFMHKSTQAVGQFRIFEQANETDVSYLNNILTPGTYWSSTVTSEETRSNFLSSYRAGYTGTVNTNNIVNNVSGTNNASWARSIANPITGAMNGFWWCSYELQLIMDNLSTVNSILSKIGGAQISYSVTGSAGQGFANYAASDEYGSYGSGMIGAPLRSDYPSNRSLSQVNKGYTWQDADRIRNVARVCFPL